MKTEKQKLIKDIEEMLEEIDYMQKNNIFLDEYEELEMKRLNVLVSQVWLWFMSQMEAKK